VYSQISTEELPVSFVHNLKTSIEQQNLDVQFTKIGDNVRTKIIEGDTITFSDPTIGELFDVSISKNNRGTWTAMDNGDSIWQLQINSNTGSYMMLVFDDFHLPQGSKLFVYSTDKKQVLGAFTDANNVPSNKFTTSPLKTNSLIIEYYKPYYVKEEAILNIKSVGIIDKIFTETLTKNFGNSKSCMINAMCPEYNNWCNERRSVALIIRVSANGNEIRICSGSLVNNERSDGKPFFLTAFHCIDCDNNGLLSQSEKDELQYWLFVFNYQSPNCSNPITEPTLTYSMTGATYLRGVSYTKGSDYALLQLKYKPPKNYNVYYNGWSNDKDDMTNTGVCIHHPVGDIKKIAEWDKVVSEKLDFWKVKYTQGSIERGSSGSPLFNNAGYVVGQQSHVNSYDYFCKGNLRGFYGRFDKSWHDYGLCYELNPNRTSMYIVSMGGFETCKQNWNFNNCNDLHTSANVSLLNYSSLGTRQYDGVYNAKNNITAENTTIQSGTTVVFEAGNSVILKPGFHAKAGSTFSAKIGDCQLGCNNGKRLVDNEMVIFNGESIENDIPHKTLKNASFNTDTDILIYPNPASETVIIEYHQFTGVEEVKIFDITGKSLFADKLSGTISNIDISSFSSGMYLIKVITQEQVHVQKLIKK
jgi:hypothetical protein